MPPLRRAGPLARRLARLSRQLAVALQRQEQTQWCWAACTTSVAAFFDAASRWTQCRLADAAHGQTACCRDGATDACNRPWYLDRALERTGNLAGKTGGAAAWETVREEIDAGRPVGVRIGWRGGGGHFVLITGYRAVIRQPRVHVEDPWTGASELTLGDLAARYQGTGAWTHTYRTRA
jgi:hypothetical protein